MNIQDFLMKKLADKYFNTDEDYTKLAIHFVQTLENLLGISQHKISRFLKTPQAEVNYEICKALIVNLNVTIDELRDYGIIKKLTGYELDDLQLAWLDTQAIPAEL